ncbi:hypothetical protein POM88_038487 [Heracleum sosnowskyi]|uniref:Uncharacterized protein n=1 Tax=Heracleum sosnowskyi TaxID=360622 RepID=A0AAD8M6Y0_9APIA|nr:hypothetical protein POM88_038487 [Heracleum sosnowskyi]
MDVFSESVLTDLHKKGDCITWFLLVRGSNEYDFSDKEYMVTGFSVSDDGLIMSVAHAFHDLDLENVTIKGRRLDTNVFRTLRVKCIRMPWDVVILEDEDVEDDDFGVFVSDGTLYRGQPLLICGNSHDYVGSNLVGTVGVSCVEDVTLPTGNEKCRSFDFDAWRSAEPRYRMFGDMWNKQTCNGNEIKDEFIKNCHPMVPYILCHGFSGRGGLSGSPAFNSDGKIVGMLSAVVRGYWILIHVTVLRHFLSEVLSDEQTDDEEKLAEKKDFQNFIQDM